VVLTGYSGCIKLNRLNFSVCAKSRSLHITTLHLVALVETKFSNRGTRAVSYRIGRPIGTGNLRHFQISGKNIKNNSVRKLPVLFQSILNWNFREFSSNGTRRIAVLSEPAGCAFLVFGKVQRFPSLFQFPIEYSQ